MKIESKHGSAKPAYAAVATMIAATTLVSGCGLQYAGGLTETTPYSSEVELDGDVTCATEETIALPSRDYFERVSTEYTLSDIIREIGEYDRMNDTDEVRYEWDIGDDKTAVVYFDSEDKVKTVMIISNDTPEILYVRNKVSESSAEESTT